MYRISEDPRFRICLVSNDLMGEVSPKAKPMGLSGFSFQEEEIVLDRKIEDALTCFSEECGQLYT